jgi:hypothetical protein
LTDTLYVKGKHRNFHSSKLYQTMPAIPCGEGTLNVRETRESLSKLIFESLVPAEHPILCGL